MHPYSSVHLPLQPVSFKRDITQLPRQLYDVLLPCLLFGYRPAQFTLQLHNSMTQLPMLRVQKAITTATPLPTPPHSHKASTPAAGGRSTRFFDRIAAFFVWRLVAFGKGQRLQVVGVLAGRAICGNQRVEGILARVAFFEVFDFSVQVVDLVPATFK